MKLHIDFETRSEVDLLACGAHVYMTDPSTEVLMMAYAFGEEPAQLWFPDQEFPQRIIEHIENNKEIHAFNAQFERLVFWYILGPDFDVPEPALDQFYCTAAQARANNMPGNLDDCARMCGADHKKASGGKALIKLFCVPAANGKFNNAKTHPKEWQQFCDYCIDDTEAERDISKYMRPLTLQEEDDYWVCERINDRGMRIDRELAIAAIDYAEEEQRDLMEEIIRLTDGRIKKCRGKFITKWVYDRLPDDNIKRHMHVYKNGELRLTFDRNARERLLSESELDPVVREVVECSDFAQAASTGKFAAMVNRSDPDDCRVRGAYIFNGAAGTGRYSARGLQPHNMPRKATENAERIRDAFWRGVAAQEICALSGDNIMQTLKGLLRYAIVAERGKTFVCGDWSQIEGRVNPWLANSEHGEQKLEVYADAKRDVYLETASDIVGEIIVGKNDPRRQAFGKVPELSLGFGGGKGALAAMARGYGVALTPDLAGEVVARWREANPWAPRWWYELFKAALGATQDAGTPYTAGRVSYLFQNDFLGGTLWCLLPSGRLLAYPQCRAEWKENRFGEMAWVMSYAKSAWKPKSDETEWPRAYLWPGLLCENVTQAAAADILREALGWMDKFEGANVVLHTHDELMLEVPESEVDKWTETLHGAMVTNPDWAEDLPLAAEIWTGKRYRK